MGLLLSVVGGLAFINPVPWPMMRLRLVDGDNTSGHVFNIFYVVVVVVNVPGT